MPEQVRFGIGCFHFGLKKQPPFKFETSEYVKQVEIFLQSISNITNINIERDQVFDVNFMIQEQPFPIGLDTVPIVNDLHITFEIYIPFRIQEQMSRSKGFPSEKLSTEKFRVVMAHAYHCAATFVQPIDANGKDDPSDAVYVVREFLSEQNQAVHSDYVEFQVLGPTPFHADLYITKPQDMEAPWLFWHEEEDSPGYDRIDFYYDPDVFRSIEEARDLIFHQIEDEIGFYYHIIQTENMRSTDWKIIKEGIDSIIEMQRIKGLRG